MLGLPLTAQTLDYTCGAACFESMYRYFFSTTFGEMYFAEKLGNLKLGYTPPEAIVELAKTYLLESTLRVDCQVSDLLSAYQEGKVVFVTWWDEDAGHYGLIEHITEQQITLMDSLVAKEDRYLQMELSEFKEYWKMRGSKMISVWKTKKES